MKEWQLIFIGLIFLLVVMWVTEALMVYSLNQEIIQTAGIGTISFNFHQDRVFGLEIYTAIIIPISAFAIWVAIGEFKRKT
jgi:hypothetical protein